MNTEVTEIVINGVAYIQKDAAPALAPSTDGMRQVLVRSTSAGVHYGWMKARDGGEVLLINARRAWYWSGACSLSQLAAEGTSKPKECKFSVPVPEITVLGVIEIIPLTPAGAKNLNAVPQWKQ